ncbi:uncharacterized protein LOC144042668 isoform X1 [Vanacampus margaritifer]
MSSKKMAIMNSLETLSRKNLDKFRSALVDRRGDRKVPLSKVENKDVTEITDVLVSTFTEDGAPAVIIELLNDIQCRNEAKKLNDKIAKLETSTDKSSAGAKGRTAHSKGGSNNTSNQDDKIAKLKSSAAKTIAAPAATVTDSAVATSCIACYQGSAVFSSVTAHYQAVAASAATETDSDGNAGCTPSYQGKKKRRREKKHSQSCNLY